MAVVLLSLAALLSACGGDDSAPPAALTETSAVIGPAGGTLDGPDGAQVVIPAGALAADTTITIAKRDSGAPTVLPDGFAASGATYEFTPHDIVFAQPVTMRIPFAGNPQASAQDVLRASPGEPWLPMALTPANGYAEWQSATFSWYTATACAWTGPNPDPYPCSGAGGNTVLTATPGNALTQLWQWQGQTNYRATAAATLQLTTTFSGPPDCSDLRVDFKRRRASDTRAVVLASVPATLTSTTPGSRVRGTASFTVELTDADNGQTIVIAHGSCRRAYQSPSRASLAPEQQRIGGFNAFVFDASIPRPPAPVAPQVTQPPQSITVTEPAAASFTAAASGSPAPSVQWQLSIDGGATWSNIAGATGLSYTTAATTVADNGKRFRAVFTNSAGSATSTAAQLTVNAPPPPPPPPAGAALGKVAAGEFHTCAVKADATVACWGLNTSGQVLPGNNNDQSTPVVVPGLSGIVYVAVGMQQSCAIDGSGRLWCWGGGRGAPQTLKDANSIEITGVKAVAMGYAHMCYVDANSAVRCRGDNSMGQLGQGNTSAGSATYLLVQSAAGAFSGAVALVAGYAHTCALTSAAAVVCWGDGPIGNGATSATTASSAAVGSGATALASGSGHVCAVVSGNVVCWGGNANGQLGNGNKANQLVPVAVNDTGGLLGGATMLAAQTKNTCAIPAAGRVVCWGAVAPNSLNGVDTLVPTAQGTLQQTPIAISSGWNHSCALAADGTLDCWGSNQFGALGTGNTGTVNVGGPTRPSTQVLGGAVYWH
jgi:alpha-tubulin suppressor-like RCC1 family protein